MPPAVGNPVGNRLGNPVRGNPMGNPWATATPDMLGHARAKRQIGSRSPEP